MKEQTKRDRLDKVLAAQTVYSRSQIHRLLSSGKIRVNGETVRKTDARIDPDTDQVELDGQLLRISRFCYLMLNKPRGVVCATSDAAHQTVLDLVPEEWRRAGLFPAGRLDKETEGFVLITDDGDFAHRILAPKSHLPKSYLALLDKPFSPEVVAAFAAGVLLPPESKREKRQACEGTPARRNGAQCLPAMLTADAQDYTRARVVVRQGMYHQVRRMFEAFDLQVLSLYREAIGQLQLDRALAPGECRPLRPEELLLLETKAEK